MNFLFLFKEIFPTLILVGSCFYIPIYDEVLFETMPNFTSLLEEVLEILSSSSSASLCAYSSTFSKIG